MKRVSHTWRQAVSISLWRYTENEGNYPGWHINADAIGCESLVTLLKALSADGAPASRTITLTRPNAPLLTVPNNKGSAARFKAPSKLRISFASQPDQWLFPPRLDLAELSFGDEWLEPLSSGISGIPLGIGDYSIGIASKDSLQLWFWWQVGNA